MFKTEKFHKCPDLTKLRNIYSKHDNVDYSNFLRLIFDPYFKELWHAIKEVLDEAERV